MRNSLELELNHSIMHANQSFYRKDYKSAVKKYSECLFLYAENRKYNESIATDFELQLCSLKGLALMEDQQYSEAERQFDHCLNLNPINPLTLHRRANLMIKLNRIGQAIEDIQKAMLYEPQNKQYRTSLDEIRGRISQLAEQSEKDRLLFLIECLQSKFQQTPNLQKFEQEEQQEQEDNFINFSKLKKIDRISLKIVSNKKRNSILCFKEDLIVQYQSNEIFEKSKLYLTIEQIKFKMQQQEQQLKTISQIQDNFEKQTILINTINPSIKRKILRNGSVFLSESSESSFQLSKKDQIYSENNVISALSIKNIDGKMLKNQSDNVRFVSSQNNFQGIQLRKGNQIQKKNKLNGKKSILRSSFKHTNRVSQNLLCHSHVNRSSFFGLKNIDGAIKKPKYLLRKSQLIQNKQNLQQCTQQKYYQNPIISDSSDDEINQHHVFEKTNQEEILKVLQNMKSISGGSQRCDGSQTSNSNSNSKKSILKNNSNAHTHISIIHNNNSIQRTTNWKKSTKSVCFQTS